MMKKVCALITALLILITALVLTGCDTATVRVESKLSLSPDFSGSRTVDILYPLSADIDAIKDTLVEKAPADISGVSFEYLGVEEAGYRFELKIDFIDKPGYEKAISALIGRDPMVFLSVKDTVLAKGARMREDFDASELISWVTRETAAESATASLEFDYSANAVNIGAEVFNSGSMTDVSSMEGNPVGSIAVFTSNSKSGSYDRTFTVTMPNATYNADREKVEQYFLTNTARNAASYGWLAKGENMEYTVTYKDLSLEDLRLYTGMILDTSSVSVYYDDRDNASTPLSEGNTFEESFDTFSFVGEGGDVKILYSYALPTETTYGEGMLSTDGVWSAAGSWQDGVYAVETGGTIAVRVPDNTQYKIAGVNFYLESEGDGMFKRTTDLLYSTGNGRAGRDYALSFFKSKGIEVEARDDTDALVCSVVCEGTVTEITDSLVKAFGSGNFMTYDKRETSLSLVTKTTFTDYVSIGYMLNSQNADVPMNYYVRSVGEENITSLSANGADTTYTSQKNQYISVPITGGVAEVTYRGNIPIVYHIVLYILVGVLLLALTVFIAVMLLRRAYKKNLHEAKPADTPKPIPEQAESAEPEQPAPADESTPSLSQTTTFSIFELGALSRNKEYVEEINKDVEQRLEADRLEERKKELKAKELAEMERKVYGNRAPEPENTPVSADEEEQEFDLKGSILRSKNAESHRSERDDEDDFASLGFEDDD